MELIYISFVIEIVCSWFTSSLAIFCFAEINQNMTLLTGPYMACGQYNSIILSVLVHIRISCTVVLNTV